MIRSLTFGAVAFLALLPAQVLAQEPNQAKLFDRGNFKGRSITLDGPVRLLTPFTAKSIQIPPGQSWELCSGNTYTGCKEYNQSDNAMVTTLRSARPVAPVITAAPTSGASAAVTSVAGGPSPSLRGLGSEYFVAPVAGGNRILVGSGRSEDASRAAEDFCRSHGWRLSAYERLQSIGGQTYLADVLCSESKR